MISLILTFLYSLILNLLLEIIIILILADFFYLLALDDENADISQKHDHNTELLHVSKSGVKKQQVVNQLIYR